MNNSEGRYVSRQTFLSARHGNISPYATINASSFQPFEPPLRDTVVGLKSTRKIITLSLYGVRGQVQESSNKRPPAVPRQLTVSPLAAIAVKAFPPSFPAREFYFRAGTALLVSKTKEIHILSSEKDSNFKYITLSFVLHL